MSLLFSRPWPSGCCSCCPADWPGRRNSSPIEYDENGTGPVATYTATDPEGTAITSWTLAGTDADAFTIVVGVLRFAKTPDYEMPADVAGTFPNCWTTLRTCSCTC